MEDDNPDPSRNHSRKTLRRSGNSHISMSDNESTTSQVESWYSPLRHESLFRSDDTAFQNENDNQCNKNCKSLVSVDKHYSPGPSPGKSNAQPSPPAGRARGRLPRPHSERPTSENVDLPAAGGRRDRPGSNNHDFPVRGNSPVVLGLNRLGREEVQGGVKKLGAGGLEEGYGGGAGDEVGGERESRAAVEEILRKSERSLAVVKTALVLRVFEAIACLISFSVMAADRTQGWSGDSFDRYKEYRYCLAVNVIGFAYSVVQAYDLGYHLGTEKHIISHHLRYHFTFSMDQILAYLLMSASSSAATRVTDWILNWGKDEFTLMASASISMSFLAFVGFAFSSLMSGSNLCNRDST